MNEILKDYREGNITIAECWDKLKDLRQFKPDGEPDIKAPKLKTPIPTFPLNALELKAIEYLQKCSFGVWNQSKRFIQQVKDSKELTARQREYLHLLVWRHRRQIFHGDTNARAKSYIERMKV